jgi:hypothetical protein
MRGDYAQHCPQQLLNRRASSSNKLARGPAYDKETVEGSEL